MTTPLLLYMANAASVTLPTANTYYTIAGTPSQTFAYTTFGTQTGYFEVIPQGAGSVTTLGSIGAPSGKGFLYDVTTLEGNQFVAGTWTPTVRLNCAQGVSNPQAGTFTADIIMRFFKRSSAGNYTLLIQSTALAQTINFAFTNYTLPNVITTRNSVGFVTGDKLYGDVWLNVTSNTDNNVNEAVRLNRMSTDTVGFTGDVNTITTTPGYQTAVPATSVIAGTRRREER